jgi:uncharacterized SAM-binding protein YcdF (DUF218 family)
MRRPQHRLRRRTRSSAMRIVVAILLLLIAAWVFGLFWFVGQIPKADAGPPAASADAVVVLTGGSGRLEAGLDLLARRKAQKLFVSGVYQGVDVKALLDIAQESPSEVEQKITLGYRADDTAGNAMETADWMRQNGFTSMLLVTANYHLPRSLLEFHGAMPGIRIVPSPAFPERFKLRHWWAWPGSAALIVSEYNKYIVAVVRHGVRGLVAGLLRL